MKWNMAILPQPLRLAMLCFLLVSSIGFGIGVFFIEHTTHFSSKGIQQNYLGNEEDENAEEMKFEKSKREILTTIHNHITGMSVLFLAVAIIFSLTPFAQRYRWLMVEPFVSLVLTFGGIYFLWAYQVMWLSYVILLSGMAMTASFYLMIGFSVYSLLKR
jgi:hypothetical protein